MRKGTPTLKFRLRFPDSKADAFGPGKADLLEFIRETGSIRSAASKMSMSYNRAWKLVQSMNVLFEAPLVVSERGGDTGGGATLTVMGKNVLVRYRRMEKACERACSREWGAIKKIMK